MTASPPTPSAACRTEALDRAVRLRDAGEAGQARTLLLGLGAAHPQDADIAYQTAWTHDVLGLEAEAVPFYERALAEPAALTVEDRAGALLGLGSTYRVLGRFEDAVRVLRQGVTEFPGDGALRTFLAMALHHTGEHTEAMGLLLALLADTSEDRRVREYHKAIRHYAQDLDALG
ncbi:tetratricopeptide repeat protein [Streptomyces sp. NPDC007088]|uniref:tetratricopeptide repeat protein n=1 Tax=Streptomyces sp. NPDC007088 TaxID=3364773 RepID=UPI00369BF5A8